MTAQVRQGGGSRILRLGHQPHDNIAVGDNATDLIMLDDNHVANLGVPHGAGRLVHRGGAGQRHGVGGHELTNLLGHRRPLLLGPAVSDTARWGSGAGGIRQAPHGPYRHGTVWGTAPTSRAFWGGLS